MIPKTIHYIWVGSPIPESIQNQIDKNNQFLEDYIVKIWTEKNMPKLNVFAQRAYDEKRWAFVSDYLRFVILHEEGGIYLDTDMDLLKPLDNLLGYDFVAGWNRGEREIYTGIVAVPKSDLCIARIIEIYDALDGTNFPTSPEIMTACYHEKSNKSNFHILPSQYFYPLLDGERATSKRLEYAYANHLWHESWRTYVPLRRFLRRIGIMKLYHWFKFQA